MNSLTGDFDLVVEVTGPAVQRIVEGMHGAGVLSHMVVRGYQNKNVELIINCPRIFLQSTTQPGSITRASATSRVLYHSRSIRDATDPGMSVIADVTIPVKLYLTNGDPAPLDGNAYLAADWSETSAADIGVYSGDPAVVAEVKGALLDFIHTQGGGSYPIPSIGTNPPIGSVAFQFIQGAGNWLAVGMNVGTAIKGSKLQLQNVFIAEDWGLAASSDFTVGQIFASFSAQLGGLPPPHGAGQVLVQEGPVCVIPNPFGGCILSANEQVYLERLDIGLEYGNIAISGTLKQVTDSIFIPPISADFLAFATLSLGPNDSIQVTVSQPSIQLNQWYAQLLNTLAGGAFTTAISNGIQMALQSSSGTALSDVVSAATLQSIAALGGIATVNLAVTTNSISVVPEAIITQGSLTVDGLSAPPVSDAVAIRGPSALTMNLNALGSWSPAHHSTSFAWDFGDGSPPFDSTDAIPAVAVEHTWPSPGEYVVNLAVSNEAGVASSTQLVVKPGILQLLAPQAANLIGPWAICSEPGDYSVTFTVLASGYPAPDAIVVIRTSTTPDEIATAYTDQFGQATFVVNNSMFTGSPPTGSPANLMAGMLVNAFCGDYTWAWNYLWLWDCAALMNRPTAILEEFAMQARALAVEPPPSFAPGLAEDLGLSQLLLTTLARATAKGSRVLPLDLLWRTDGWTDQQDQQEQFETFVRRATENIEAIRAAAEQEASTRQTPTERTRIADVPQTSAQLAAGRQAAYERLAARTRGENIQPDAESQFRITPKSGSRP